jgi:hypothetical protein
MSRLKSIGLLMLMALAGAISMCLLTLYSPSINARFFAQWTPLARPPDKAIRVIVTVKGLWVRTQSGQVYGYDFVDGTSCQEDCWKAASVYPKVSKSYLPLDMCGPIPVFSNGLDSVAVCRPYGVGGLLSVYAIGQDGNIYVSESHGPSDTDPSLCFSPVVGAIVGLLIGFFILPGNEQSSGTVEQG